MTRAVQLKSLLCGKAVALIALALSLAACGGGGGAEDATPAASASPQAIQPTVDLGEVESSRHQAQALAIGDQTRIHTMLSGLLLRAYMVTKPKACTTDCPVVVDLHGFTSNASQEAAASGIRRVAGAAGAITVFPDGIQTSWNAGSSTYAITGCCGTAQWTDINDVSFLRSMIAKLKADYPMIDSKRVYFTGISNGCAMSQRMAAEASDVVAAAACTSHYLMTAQTSLPRPISVTEIHGIQDSLVPYPNTAPLYVGAKNNIKRWAVMNHCSTTPTRTGLTADSFVEEYPNCSGGVKVKLYSLKSNHITYINTDGVDVGQITWDSLKDERLP